MHLAYKLKIKSVDTMKKVSNFFPGKNTVQFNPYREKGWKVKQASNLFTNF